MVHARTTSAVLVVLLAVPAATVVAGPAVAAPVRPAVSAAQASLDGMTLAQRVGQVFMVGGPATGVGGDTVAAVRDRHVGSVILTGRSTAGVGATAAVSAGLQAQVTPASTAGVGLLVGTDQEGGYVQVLQGPGFDAMPTALVQGGSDPGVLRQDAGRWGAELLAAGVNVDLGPVLDTVPSAAAAPGNPPIGAYDREYGYTPGTVASHGTAFALGMADAGVAATVKHFPGLGRVTGNTDTTAGVTDTVTTRHDAYLTPFATAVRAGAPLLMVSTAYYSQIDPAHPAAFSSTVIRQLVRKDLGFTGVVVSDDLANARQVAAWTPGDRALQFLAAGGDLVLTVDPGQLPAMYDAVLARAQSDAPFRARVQQAALRVLTAKQARGLVPPDGLGLIGARYEALGGPSCYLGEPVSPQYPTPGGVTQDFVAGSILWSPPTGARVVHGAILADYLLVGGPGGPLGYPTTDERPAPGGGRVNSFAGSGAGSVYWSAGTGAHAVYGAIRVAYGRHGGSAGALGLPTTDEAGTPDGLYRFNDFVHGRITWRVADGHIEVSRSGQAGG